MTINYNQLLIEKKQKQEVSTFQNILDKLKQKKIKPKISKRMSVTQPSKTTQEGVKQGRKNTNQERKNQRINLLNIERKEDVSTRSVIENWKNC